MASPRVFISSTCYDLKHIRESLKYFVRTIGYEPVLSDDGDVYYNPAIHTHDSCLKEVETCQIFVLIIGGRYGGKFKENDTSITNNEYKTAIKCKIPIFALVDSNVYSDHNVFTNNKGKDIADKINYPSIDNIKIFNFIDEVRRSSTNNAIYAFKNFSDIEGYLRKQWAGMMFDFLAQRFSEEKSSITNKLLDDLTIATNKSEELIKILLKNKEGINASNVIHEVDQKIAAQRFFKLIVEKLGVSLYDICDGVDEISAESLVEKINASDNWVSFLDKINDIEVSEVVRNDDESGIVDIVFWPNFKPYLGGRQIGEITSDGEYNYTETESLDESFKALKELDDSIKLEIFNQILRLK